MKILFLGNSKFLRMRIRPSLDKIKKLKYEIASIKFYGSDKKIKYNNYENALKNGDFDVVYISLINKLHYKFAKKALFLGHHVIVDKPLAISEKKCVELIKIAKKNRLLLAEAVIFNYHKLFDFIYKYTNKLKLISRVEVNFNIPVTLNKIEMKEKKLDCLSDMSSYAAAINRLFFNKHILKKNIFFEKYKKTKFIKKFNLHINYINNKFFNGYFAYGSEYISSIKFFCNKFILEIPFQAFAMRNSHYDLIIKKNNSISKIKFKDDTVINFFKLIDKFLKNKKFYYFYNIIENDIKFKKKLKLFYE